MEILLEVFTIFLIIVLQVLGIGLHVMQKIVKLGNDYPDKSRQEIKDAFFKEDWDTLSISAIILVLNVVAHIIVVVYAPEIAAAKYWNIPFNLWSFFIALVLGYAGQRIIYKLLGTAENFLNKKVDDHLK